MGFYVNPPNMSKEEWLRKHGSFVGRVGDHLPKFQEFRARNLLPVVLVDNGLFTAAGIAYSEKEYEIFTDPTDPRPRFVFAVPIVEIEKVCPEICERRIRND